MKSLADVANLFLKKALLAGALVFLPSLSFAHTQDISSLIKENENEAKLYGNEVVARLAQFKKQVEADAFVATMKLCEGYRRSQGLGPSAYHGRYMFSLNDSLAEWGRVFKEGLIQPFTNIYGYKADYLDLNEIPLWHVRSWFQSMYSLYLLGSSGFLQASMHCLNTMDQGEIQKFAIAIMFADVQATLTTEVIAGNAIASVLARSLRFVFRPARYLGELLRTRITKPQKIVIGTVVLPVALDSMGETLRRLDKQMANIREGLSKENTRPLTPDEAALRLRFMTLARGFSLLELALKDRAAEAEFQEFVRTELTADAKRPYLADLAVLKSLSAEHRTAFQQTYLELLEHMRPLL